MWKYDEITHINLEVSSICNAACPWCPRYVDMSTNVNPEIDVGYISLEKFKKYFPEDFIKQIRFWTYSGDYGDACTNPQLIEILEHTININPDTRIQINTNGGMKNDKFWTQLGNLFVGHDMWVVFSIDGLENTNHIYRRNVKWDKLMKNVSAYMSTGAKAHWDFLTFKHNEHQVEEVKSFANTLGFDRVNIKLPEGFEGSNMLVKDADYNVIYEIEPINMEQIKNPLPKANRIIYTEIQEQVETWHKDTVGEIKCFSLRDGMEMRVTHKGEVMPCCMFGHMRHYPRHNSQYHKAQVNHILKDKKIDLNEWSLKEILDSDPFRWVYENWEDKKCLTCVGSCNLSETQKPIMQQIFNGEGLYGIA